MLMSYLYTDTMAQALSPPTQPRSHSTMTSGDLQMDVDPITPQTLTPDSITPSYPTMSSKVSMDALAGPRGHTHSASIETTGDYSTENRYRTNEDASTQGPAASNSTQVPSRAGASQAGARPDQSVHSIRQQSHQQESTAQSANPVPAGAPSDRNTAPPHPETASGRRGNRGGKSDLQLNMPDAVGAITAEIQHKVKQLPKSPESMSDEGCEFSPEFEKRKFDRSNSSGSLWSTGSSLSSSSNEWDEEIEKYKKDMPPHIRTQYFDALILYHENDRKEAIKFRDHLIYDIQIRRGPVRAILYDDPEFEALSSMKIGHLEKAVERCTYIFMYMTPNFIDDSWLEFSSESCLMLSITDKSKRWCVVPIYTEPRNTYRIPMGLNTLKGINYYGSQDEFHHKGLARLIEDKVYVRVENDRALADKQRKWLDTHKKELAVQAENRRRIEIQSELEVRQLHNALAHETNRYLRGGALGPVLHHSNSTSTMQSPGSMHHSISTGSLKPVHPQDPAIQDYLLQMQLQQQQGTYTMYDRQQQNQSVQALHEHQMNAMDDGAHSQHVQAGIAGNLIRRVPSHTSTDCKLSTPSGPILQVQSKKYGTNSVQLPLELWDKIKDLPDRQKYVEFYFENHQETMIKNRQKHEANVTPRQQAEAPRQGTMSHIQSATGPSQNTASFVPGEMAEMPDLSLINKNNSYQHVSRSTSGHETSSYTTGSSFESEQSSYGPGNPTGFAQSVTSEQGSGVPAFSIIEQDGAHSVPVEQRANLKQAKQGRQAALREGRQSSDGTDSEEEVTENEERRTRSKKKKHVHYHINVYGASTVQVGDHNVTSAGGQQIVDSDDGDDEFEDDVIDPKNGGNLPSEENGMENMAETGDHVLKLGKESNMPLDETPSKSNFNRESQGNGPVVGEIQDNRDTTGAGGGLTTAGSYNVDAALSTVYPGMLGDASPEIFPKDSSDKSTMRATALTLVKGQIKGTAGTGDEEPMACSADVKTSEQKISDTQMKPTQVPYPTSDTSAGSTHSEDCHGTSAPTTSIVTPAPSSGLERRGLEESVNMKSNTYSLAQKASEKEKSIDDVEQSMKTTKQAVATDSLPVVVQPVVAFKPVAPTPRPVAAVKPVVKPMAKVLPLSTPQFMGRVNKDYLRVVRLNRALGGVGSARSVLAAGEAAEPFSSDTDSSISGDDNNDSDTTPVKSVNAAQCGYDSDNTSAKRIDSGITTSDNDNTCVKTVNDNTNVKTVDGDIENTCVKTVDHENTCVKTVRDDNDESSFLTTEEDTTCVKSVYPQDYNIKPAASTQYLPKQQSEDDAVKLAIRLSEVSLIEDTQRRSENAGSTTQNIQERLQGSGDKAVDNESGACGNDSSGSVTTSTGSRRTARFTHSNYRLSPTALFFNNQFPPLNESLRSNNSGTRGTAAAGTPVCAGNDPLSQADDAGPTSGGTTGFVPQTSSFNTTSDDTDMDILEYDMIDSDEGTEFEHRVNLSDSYTNSGSRLGNRRHPRGPQGANECCIS